MYRTIFHLDRHPELTCFFRFEVRRYSGDWIFTRGEKSRIHGKRRFYMALVGAMDGFGDGIVRNFINVV